MKGEQEGAIFQTLDVSNDIKEFIKYSKLNPNKKMKLLEQIFELLLKHEKFSLQQKQLDEKFQTLWYNCIIGNENNKNLMKILSKIIFVYSLSIDGFLFKFPQKYVKFFIKIFLKEKSNELRSHFSHALRIHFQQVQMKEIPFYSQCLLEKSQEVK